MTSTIESLASRTAQLRVLICAAILALVAAVPSTAQENLSEAALTSFLVQCIATDAGGKPDFPSPERPRCPGRGPQGVSDRAEWRKHDWGTLGENGPPRLGHQVSDSVLDHRGGRNVVVQTFDFGDGERRFGRFDKGNGDGGDLLAVIDGAVWGFFTEDGGAGEQWFIGESCQQDSGPSASRKAWLFFGSDVKRDTWTDAVARLTIARSPNECPTRGFGSAYTRYLRDTIEVPFRVLNGDKPATLSGRPVDTIVSDHFGGKDLATADHLERFYFGRGLGKYRWERWEQLSRTSLKDAEKRADDLSGSGRCMPIAHSDSPGEGWVMVDCRTWTTLVRQTRPWSVADFGWPGRVLDAAR